MLQAKGGKLHSLTFMWTADAAGAPATIEAAVKGKKFSANVSPTGFMAIEDGANVQISSDNNKFGANTVSIYVTPAPSFWFFCFFWFELILFHRADSRVYSFDDATHCFRFFLNDDCTLS